MKRLPFVLVTSMAVLLLIAQVQPAPAHEHRPVGPYEITFGWRVEPAYVGQFNGPEILIVELGTTTDEHSDEHEHEDEADAHSEGSGSHGEGGTPVVGAEETLQLEVSLGPASKVLTLRAAFGEPGHYIADLIPTRAGDYTFRLTGTIGETAIDETFTSSTGFFSSVEPATDIMFPDTDLPTVQELQAQIDELRAMIEALRNEQ